MAAASKQDARFRAPRRAGGAGLASTSPAGRHIRYRRQPALCRPGTSRRLPAATLAQLNERSREIFRQIVESYLATGEPVGSRNLSRLLPMTLSPASVRNVMADLEQLGLIYAPHTSAGRLPTEAGLRFFVDALLEVGDLSAEERRAIEAQVAGARPAPVAERADRGDRAALRPVARRRRGADRQDRPAPQAHRVRRGSSPTRALVVLVGEDGPVENRIIDLPPGLPPSALIEAANYLNARIRGRTLAEARAEIERAR